MRLAPVQRAVQPSRRGGSVRTPAYPSGRREATDPFQQASPHSAPPEHAVPIAVSAPAPEEAKAPKTEKPEPVKPEHPAVPAPNGHAAPPATTHPEPPAPAAGEKDKAPDEPKPAEPGDDKNK